MSFWIPFLNGGAVSIFGSVLAASFCGVLKDRKKGIIFACAAVFLLLVQGLVYSVWGSEFLRTAYPLITHLPLLILLCCLSREFIRPLVSILFAYLCCQMRRWIALLVTFVFSGSTLMQDLVELLITFPLLAVLLCIVSGPVMQLWKYPVKIQMRFGIIPLLYYVFDYLACVYTDLLFRGLPVVIEFMPFVCSVGYLVFVLHNSIGQRSYNQLQQINTNLDLRLDQAVREIDALRESQKLAMRYRHDLRHHLQYVSSCIENGQDELAQSYISGICEEIEIQKVQCYCENEAANLILSAFVARAEKQGISLKINGVLPQNIKVSDSDLCVLLSNALENAIHASAGSDGLVDVQFFEKDGKVFLQVKNSCKKPVKMKKGIPVSESSDHGFGVPSICAIVARYDGVITFLQEDGVFILRLSI